MHKSLDKVLKTLLIFGGCYFIFDGLLHFLGIKLLSVDSWPIAAKAYANLISIIYASFIFLAAIVAFTIRKDIQKYKSLVLLSGIWALSHGLVLLFLVWGNDYQEIFKAFPSLLVWLPIYREYLTINSLILFIYSATVYTWYKS